MLSPKWTGISPNESMPRPYSELTELGPKGIRANGVAPGYRVQLDSVKIGDVWRK